MKSQIEKFRNRQLKAGKAAADRAAENKTIEMEIAQRIEAKKDMYKAMDILSHSVTLLTQQMKSIMEENTQLKQMVSTLVEQTVVERKSEFDIIAEHYIDMHKKGQLVSRNEMILLSVDRYAFLLHKQRADQIKEQGFFVDPPMPDDIKYDFKEDEVSDEPMQEVVKVATSNWSIVSKRGQKSKVVLAALEHVNTHVNEKGRIKWPREEADLKALVKSFLVLAQYEGVDIHNTFAMQKSRYNRVSVKVSEQFGSYKNLIKELF